MVITRQTLGWVEDPTTTRRKEKDWISYSQLREKTGKQNEAISKGLRELEDLKIIEVLDEQAQVIPKQSRTGKKLYYRLVTSSKIEEVHSNLFENRNSKIEDTKETHTKDRDTNVSLRENAGSVAKKTFGNTEINTILEGYKRHIGTIPTDRNPRQVAQNFRQSIQGFVRRTGEAFHSSRGQELTYDYVVEKCWQWYMKKDYARETEKLDTVRLKCRVFLDEQEQKLTERRKL